MNIKLLSSLIIASATIPSAQAALIANGDLETVVTAYIHTSPSSEFSMDASNNILDGGADTGKDAGEWLDTTLTRTFIHSTTGGNGGGGGFIQQGADSNRKARAVLFFADDGKTTTGLVNVTIDLKLSDANQFFTVELFGWNDGQTSPGLTVGGSVVNSTSWNTWTLGGATQLINNLDVDTTALDAWETVSVATVDLGTGYDNYAWRVGIVGAPADSTYAFDNLEVTAVPEPSSTALLGLGGLALILRRRRN